MAIDTNYFIAPNLEQYFVNKDTGFPLANGKVFYYQDNNRSVPKSVFRLSGSPPNYSFSALPNPVTLSSVGTIDDGAGNNVVPYYFPFDQNGDPQLYYIEVYSSDNVLQFTREGWPQNAIDESSENQVDSSLNLIPNGQFLSHVNIPADVITSAEAGNITEPVTTIAQGGWTFDRPVTSSAVDNVSFSRFAAYTENPTSSPRYALRVTTNGGSPSDAFKDARLKFNDVNKFASDTQEYTIYFSAITFNSSDFVLDLNVIKNYGTGGDAEEITNLESFNVTSTQQDFSLSFIVGSNDGKIIGPSNDDFTQFALSIPTDIAVGVEITDVVMFVGNILVDQFPITTNKDFVDRSLVPVAPNPDGFDLGLPLILTKEGLAYDQSKVGKIHPSILNYGEFGELNCDGATYRSDAYSVDGIPYRRLRNKLVDNPGVGVYGNNNIPIFGTGLEYVTASSVNDGQLMICTNSASVETSTADGAAATGFTFNDVVIGQSSTSVLGLESWTTGANSEQYWVKDLVPGFITSGNASSTGTQSLNQFPVSEEGEVVGTDVANQFIKITSSGVPAGSSSMLIRIPSNTIIPWFTLDGAGVAPGIGGIEVQINMFSTFGADDVASAISCGLSGQQVSLVTVLDGNLVVPDSYFTFSAKGQLYYVWYSLNGLGIDPLVPGAIGITVSYSASDVSQTIEISTIRAINDLYFAVPDLRGWTIKGWDNDSGVDQAILNRFSYKNTRYADTQTGLPGYIGSYQNNANLSHGHSPIFGSINSFGAPSRLTTVQYINETTTNPSDAFKYIESDGTVQTDVKNVYLNYIINY